MRFSPLAGIVAILLGAVGLHCNYNAAVVVNLPRWRADDRAVVFLGARPRNACDGEPARLTLAFLLRDDRGNGIEEGARLRIGEDTLTVTTAGAGATLEARAVTVSLAASETGDGGIGDGGDAGGDGGLGSLTATVSAVRYVPLTSGGRTDRRDPVAGAMVFDNGYDVQADDSEGVRFDGAAELGDRFLCYGLGADRCAFGPTELEVLELAGSVVGDPPLAPFLRDAKELRDKLELLRAPARAVGDGPVYDGLMRAAADVERRADELAARLGPGSRGVIVLVTRDGRNESTESLDGVVAAVAARPTPVFIVARTGTPELGRIACASGGLLRLAATPADYPAAFTEVRDALRGRFEVDLDVPELAAAGPGEHALTGTLTVTVGGEAAATALQFTVTGPGS